MKYILALDPDRGYAVVKDRRIIEAGTVKGIKELEEKIIVISHLCRDAQQELVVRIELSQTKRPYQRTERLPLAVRFKVQGDVGANREKAKSLGRLCVRLGLKYEFVEPCAIKPTKKQIESITGYKGRTSEHSRDAIAIAWR